MGVRAPSRLRAALCTVATAAALLTAAPAPGNPDFAAWLAALRREAEGRGISSATIDATLTGVSLIPRVLELERRQPEFTLSVGEYLSRYVPRGRIERGREHLAANRALLDEIGAQYGVPARFVVALWGLEAEYGQRTGDFPVIGALATLAYEGRRRALFHEELLAALRILDEGHAPARNLRGSWAGAMGQSQFLPSSFLRYAVDHDGDGRRDIWSSRPDVFASIARYLAEAGWQGGETWGYAVRLPPDFDRALAGPTMMRPLSEWQGRGVRRIGGADLPLGDPPGSVLLPDGGHGPAFLVFENYHVLRRWNRSALFAIAAGVLADAIEGAGGPRAP
ncbi:MAG: lytic murein transglycosylase [Candidatus Rokuibacteriota bacterium]